MTLFCINTDIVFLLVLKVKHFRQKIVFFLFNQHFGLILQALSPLAILTITFRSIMRLAEHLTVFRGSLAALAPRRNVVGIHFV